MIPVNLVFWAVVIAYVVHVLEESVLPEVFVEKVKRLYWPEYSWRRFFGFNALLLVVNATAVIVYESFAGAWIIFPLSLTAERGFNGVYHLIETIATGKYSSGLLSSVIVWILIYLLVRYSLPAVTLPLWQISLSALIGLGLTTLMIVPLVKGMYRKKS